MSFKPGKYLNHKYNSSSGRTFTIKGKSSSSDLILSEDELVQIIGRLKDNAHTPIKKLTGSLKSDFETITKYIGLTYGTNSYSLLSNLINDQFEGDQTVPVPGTIAAIFRGSFLETTFDPVECSVLAAGSIPNNDENWKSCKNSVILATGINKSYDFSLLKMGDDPSHAYIHVNHDNYDEFRGFSSEEKKKLKKYGIEYVYLHGYEDDATKQKDLLGSATHIDQIKHRHCNSCDVKEKNSNGINWMPLVIFIIIIVIIILLLGCCYE